MSFVRKKYLFSLAYLLLLLVVLAIETFFWLKKTGYFYHEPKYKVNLFSNYQVATNNEIIPTDFLDQVSAEAFFVIDNTTQTILLEKNPQLPLAPASTTKLMTVYTALKNYDLNEIVPVSTVAALENDGGGLYPLEKVKVKDLAAASLVSSANDAAYALADYFSAGYDQFIRQMNQESKNLHLISTSFSNPVGYDHPDNVSTAHDLAILTMRVFKEKPIAEWMSLKNYVVENQDLTMRHFLFSTNELLGGEEGVIAGKTGTTPLAKEVLISIAQVNDHQYIIVVMGSEDRYQDTKIIIEWLKTNIEWQKVEFPLQIQQKTL